MLAQLEAVREGFYQVMPKDVLSKFTELELELLLHGMPVIDVEVSGQCAASRVFEMPQPLLSPTPAGRRSRAGAGVEKRGLWDILKTSVRWPGWR